MRLLSALLAVALFSVAGCETGAGDGENQGTGQTTGGGGHQGGGPSNQEFSLEQYAGKQPVLLLLAATPETESYRKFNEGLAQSQADVQRHNLVIIDVLEHNRGYPRAQLRGGQPLDAKAASDLADQYGGGHSFIVALIGKDGQILLHERKSYVEPAEVLAKLSGQ